jgi:hypothetical protein
MGTMRAGRRRAFALLFAVIAAALLSGSAWSSPRPTAVLNYSPARPLIAVDWQGPQSLPPRFRNHCRYDVNHGGWYCANHCGRDYQFYYCSPASFGCCHVGYGYCDGRGHLRCAP